MTTVAAPPFSFSTGTSSYNLTAMVFSVITGHWIVYVWCWRDLPFELTEVIVPQVVVVVAPIREIVVPSSRLVTVS